MRIAAVFLIAVALVMSAPPLFPNVPPATAATPDAATEPMVDSDAGFTVDADHGVAKDSAGDGLNVRAGSTPVEDVFRAFDLFGTWAADCGRPPSPDNPHVNVTTPGAGLVLENNDVGPGYATNRYSVLSAHRLTQQRLEVMVIFRPGVQGEERQTLVFEISNGTRRTIFNQVEDGTVRVRNGVVVSRGVKTPVLRKCG